MHNTQINRVSSTALIALSLLALLAVLTGFLQPPQPDEGTAAHIFQLSVVLALCVGALFLVTFDWRQPLRNAWVLALSGTAMFLAFALLYYLEHFYYPAHYR
jgi:hypothetical protein